MFGLIYIYIYIYKAFRGREVRRPGVCVSHDYYLNACCTLRAREYTTSQGCSHSNFEFVSKTSATASLQMAIQQTLTLVLSHEHCDFVVFLFCDFDFEAETSTCSCCRLCSSSFFDLSLQLLCLFVFIRCFILFKCVFRNPSLHYGLSATALFCSKNRTAIHLRNSLRLPTEKV